MSTAIRGFYRRYATSGDYAWHIDKRIKRVGRLCESTGTADRDEAERSSNVERMPPPEGESRDGRRGALRVGLNSTQRPAPPPGPRGVPDHFSAPRFANSSLITSSALVALRNDSLSGGLLRCTASSVATLARSPSVESECTAASICARCVSKADRFCSACRACSVRAFAAASWARCALIQGPCE